MFYILSYLALIHYRASYYIKIFFCYVQAKAVTRELANRKECTQLWRIR